jgi:hypothetical protein
MGNTNGKKFGFTSLFPIQDGEHYVLLRKYLRSLDTSNVYGSPLSNVPIIHMARFAITEDLPFQGVPAKRDTLMSRYLLFMCDFDGTTVDALVREMNARIGEVMDAIWSHCRAYPGRESQDRLAAYFEQCQLKTNLFLADRPDDEVRVILRALMYKREFIEFLRNYQLGRFSNPQLEFQRMWQALANRPTPVPGSM